jgi:transcriptional regulator with XRE-family HTH domain
MWTKSKSDLQFSRDFERSILRSAFVNVFWAVIVARKKDGGFTLKNLADRLGIGKSSVSRWFSGEPNWEMNTMADIAHALDVTLNVEAVDRKTGKRFGPAGEITVPSDAIRTAQSPGGLFIVHSANPMPTMPTSASLTEARLSA